MLNQRLQVEFALIDVLFPKNEKILKLGNREGIIKKEMDGNLSETYRKKPIS